MNAGVRETLNRGKNGLFVGIILIIASAAIFSYHSTPPIVRPTGTMDFYSDDDGRTFFEDSAIKFPPFDHDGKTAYQAEVFKNTRGDQFVAVLRRYTPDAKAQLEAQYADDLAKGHPEYIYTQKAALDISGTEIKIRGSQVWIPQSQSLAPPIVAPDGDVYNAPVDPVAPNAG